MLDALTQSQFSQIGRKLTARTGILELMDDLGRAMTIEPDMLMLGGGNPAAVPAMQKLYRERMTQLLADGPAFDRMLVNYDPPRGNPRFLEALADLLRRTYGWDITPRNMAITNGGQSAFFMLFNLLSGTMETSETSRDRQGAVPARGADRSLTVAARGEPRRKILLPLCPEYIGYADQGMEEDQFIACQPKITWPAGEAGHVFKYHIDFAAVEAALKNEAIGAIVASRPTNPTGNVLDDDEVARLSKLAHEHEVPLILDNAYGAPFPGVIFTQATPHWAPHIILTLSLSKLGLPGTRTGIVIAPEPIALAIASMTAIVGLANGTIGQQLVMPWVESGEILQFGPRILRPFYEEKSQQAIALARDIFNKAGVNWAMHASEGAFFHWLWLRDLMIPTRELYERLKARKVLIVPGEYFFFGLGEDWPHRHECLRVNFSQPEAVVREGLTIIADEARKAMK